MSLLQQLSSIKTKSKKRVGRGYSSGKGGHTTFRGNKGQKSRSKVHIWFEGGNLPLTKRIPMIRGKGRLVSLTRKETITLRDLNTFQGDVVTLKELKKQNFIDQRTQQVKIVATGKLEKKLQVNPFTDVSKKKDKDSDASQEPVILMSKKAAEVLQVV